MATSILQSQTQRLKLPAVKIENTVRYFCRKVAPAKCPLFLEKKGHHIFFRSWSSDCEYNINVTVVGDARCQVNTVITEKKHKELEQ